MFFIGVNNVTRNIKLLGTLLYWIFTFVVWVQAMEHKGPAVQRPSLFSLIEAEDYAQLRSRLGFLDHTGQLYREFVKRNGRGESVIDVALRKKQEETTAETTEMLKLLKGRREAMFLQAVLHNDFRHARLLLPLGVRICWQYERFGTVFNVLDLMESIYDAYGPAGLLKEVRRFRGELLEIGLKNLFYAIGHQKVRAVKDLLACGISAREISLDCDCMNAVTYAEYHVNRLLQELDRLRTSHLPIAPELRTQYRQAIDIHKILVRTVREEQGGGEATGEEDFVSKGSVPSGESVGGTEEPLDADEPTEEDLVRWFKLCHVKS
jgi:hypothetical protein